MSKTNVGAKLMYALRTKIELKPMFENELETLASGIGSQTIVVRRANTRFAPTLVSDIGWISITTIYPKIYDRLLIRLSEFTTLFISGSISFSITFNINNVLISKEIPFSLLPPVSLSVILVNLGHGRL